MALPNFLIIGAPKCGTTTLYAALAQHPQVFMSAQKEPGFFIHEGEVISDDALGKKNKVTDFESYFRLFDGAEGFKAVGEGTVGYYAKPETIPRIRERLGADVRLICILRDPVERAYSHFLYSVQKGLEPPNRRFEDVLGEEDVEFRNGRIRSGARFLWAGHYARHLEPWREAFGDRLHIDFFEELVRDEQGFFRRVFEFLGVDASYQVPPAKLTERSGLPKSRLIHQLVARPIPFGGKIKLLLPNNLTSSLRATVKPWRDRVVNGNIQKPPLSRELRATLTPRFEEDARTIGQWTCKDLSEWLR